MSRLKHLLVIATVLLFTDPLFAQGSITIAAWGGASQDNQRKVFFRAFTESTGIKVIEDTEPTMARIQAMVKAGKVEWDVVIIPESFVLALGKSQHLEEIDYSIFPADVLSGLMDQAKSKWGVGSILYSTVIAYNTKTFPENAAPRSWSDVWDVKRFPGPRVLHAGTYGVSPIEYALLADGVKPTELYPLDFDRAYRSLDKIRAHVVKWSTSGSIGPQALVAGEAEIAAVSHGRIPALKAAGEPIGFTWNQGLMQLDFWAIPRGAKNIREAHRFIEFASRARQQAEYSKTMPFGPTNTKALEFFTKEEGSTLASHPGNLSTQIYYNAAWWASTRPDGMTNLEYNAKRWDNWVRR